TTKRSSSAEAPGGARGRTLHLQGGGGTSRRRPSRRRAERAERSGLTPKASEPRVSAVTCPLRPGSDQVPDSPQSAPRAEPRCLRRYQRPPTASSTATSTSPTYPVLVTTETAR